MENMAEVIKAICDEEGISRFALIGHSLGGYISLAFAEKYPDLLAGLGLFHSTAFPDDDKSAWGNRAKAIEAIKKNGAFEFLKNKQYGTR